MTSGPDDEDEVSAETMRRVASVRERAAALPESSELADLLAARGRDMTPEQVRRLGVLAIAQSRQVSYLLGKLAGLLGDEAGESHAW